MHNKKILHIGKYFSPYYGGMETNLSNLYESQKKNYNVDVLVSNVKSKTEIIHEGNSRTIKLARFANVWSTSINPSMPFWIRKTDYDAIILHSPNPLAEIILYYSKLKPDLIVWYHSDVVRQSMFLPAYSFVIRKVLKKARCVIASSENLIANSNVLKDFKNKCVVMPYGIDVDRFSEYELTDDDRKSKKQKYPKGLILFAGRLVYYKGLEYMINAMSAIDSNLVIIGDGALKKALVKLIDKLNLNNKIQLFGETDFETLLKYYHLCDVFVLPSTRKSEAFGIVQLEAMACKKPVISTDIPSGVPFVNVHEKTGLVVPPFSSKALSEAINRLLKDDSLRSQYGENGYHRVRSMFSLEKMINKIDEIINQK